MLILIAAALQVETITSPPLPAAPPPAPPFTFKVQAEASRLGARVDDEFKRCGDASAYSNKYSVEAFGTARYSAEWNKAARAINNALTICRGLWQALADQEIFLVRVERYGNRHDRHLAVGPLIGLSYEFQGLEQYFAMETPYYRDLLAVGWGNPHCAERPDGYMPASSICPQRDAGFSKVGLMTGMGRSQTYPLVTYSGGFETLNSWIEFGSLRR